MSRSLVGRARGGSWVPPVLVLLLLVISLHPIGPATAQTNISGDYDVEYVFDDITPPCLSAGLEGGPIGFGMTAETRGTSNVDITLINLPSNGLDIVFNASLDQTLGVFAEDENGWTITGQFLAEGEVTFSGRVQWTQECTIDTNNTYEPVPQSFTVQARRRSGSEPLPSPSAPPAVPGGPAESPGGQLAGQVLETVCPPGVDEPSDHCRRAIEYSNDWELAMQMDTVALTDPSDEALRELMTLRGIIARAAALAAVFYGSPGGYEPRFPVVHGLLPMFAHLFVHGVTLAGTGNVEALRTTVALADDLLFAAMAEETRSGAP